MDPYQLGQDLGAITCALIPLLVIAGTVAVIWWAIARTRRDNAQREQRHEPSYPRASSDPLYDPQRSPVEPYGTAERPADQPQNEPAAQQPNAEPPVSAPLDGYQPPTAAMKKRTVTRVALIVIASLAVVIAGTAAIVAASTGPTTPVTNTAATPVATTAASTPAPASATPTGSPTPAPTTAAPSPTFKTAAAWFNGGGKTLLDTIRADSLAIRAAGKNNDATAVRDACTKVLSDASAAKGFAPIPDDQAQQHWAKSLPLIVQGALDCADAIDIADDSTSLGQAVTEMNAGFNEMSLAVTRLNALLG